MLTIFMSFHRFKPEVVRRSFKPWVKNHDAVHCGAVHHSPNLVSSQFHWFFIDITCFPMWPNEAQSIKGYLSNYCCRFCPRQLSQARVLPTTCPDEITLFKSHDLIDEFVTPMQTYCVILHEFIDFLRNRKRFVLFACNNRR
jgi:hypothetical protein